MSRKRKINRFKTRNQFRFSKSKKTGYHPHYIFGEIGDSYVSLGMTTHPKKSMKVSSIKSPNPKYKGDQYIQHKVFKMKKTAYAKKRQNGWYFSAFDMPLIRRLKKKGRRRNRK